MTKKPYFGALGAKVPAETDFDDNLPQGGQPICQNEIPGVIHFFPRDKKFKISQKLNILRKI